MMEPDDVMGEFSPAYGADLFLIEAWDNGTWAAAPRRPRTYSLQRALAVAEFMATPAHPTRVVRCATSFAFAMADGGTADIGNSASKERDPLTHHLAPVLAEVAAEHDRAIALYPNSVSLPDGTGLTGAASHALAIARHACERGERDGTLTHAHVLTEEFWEAMAESDPAKLRAELVQVAAVALKWIEDIDRRAAGGTA